MKEYRLTVRGYELDSFGHVNNAVYLNYIEQARWQILHDLDLLDYFFGNKLIMVVTELNIKYIQEAKLFDDLVVRTDFYKESPFIIFDQEIVNTNTKRRITKAKAKALLLDENRIPVDFPESIQKTDGELVYLFN
jgi:acyl-CoA thioester hydrolase